MIGNGPESRGGDDQSWVTTPSVTPEGAFSGNDMAHFTGCAFLLVHENPQRRLELIADRIGIIASNDGPLVTYRRNEDGTMDLACWGSKDCPGATVTIPALDVVLLAMPETAVALHGVCKEPTRKYVTGGKVVEVPYTPLP